MKVERNINTKGNQVPRKLVNISKLWLIAKATTKKSMKTTKPIKIIAVTKGDVKLYFLKYTKERLVKMIGAAMA